MPEAMSATEIPTLAGESSEPVVETSPDSHWISRSSAFFSPYGPPSPYPLIEQWINSGR